MRTIGIRFAIALFVGAAVGFATGEGRAATAERARVRWVFLKEKISQTLPKLSPKTLARRLRLGFKKPDPRDFAVEPGYIDRIRKTGVKIRVVSRWLNAVSVEGTPEQIRKVERLPFVSGVEAVPPPPPRIERPRPLPVAPPPHAGRPMTAPADGLLYGLSKDQLVQIGVVALHEKGWTGSGVTVAVFDNGFRLEHEAFRHLRESGRLRARWDFVSGDADVRPDGPPADDENEHGTKTLSLLAGYAPGHLIGAAFGASYLLARTEDSSRETVEEEDFWVAALEWAEAEGADVVSSSLGYRNLDGRAEPGLLDGKTLAISRAANLAAERGLFIVNAVGNHLEPGPAPEGSLNAPADALGVLAVGAVNRLGQIAEFSCRGPTADGRIKPEVVARGVQALVAAGAGFVRDSGTSFAAPLVAGAAALLLEKNRSLTPSKLREALLRTARRDGPPDNEAGYGIIQSDRAAEYAGLTARR